MNSLDTSYKWLVAVAFVAGLFMDLMDATIVNVVSFSGELFQYSSLKSLKPRGELARVPVISL